MKRTGPGVERTGPGIERTGSGRKKTTGPGMERSGHGRNRTGPGMERTVMTLASARQGHRDLAWQNRTSHLDSAKCSTVYPLCETQTFTNVLVSVNFCNKCPKLYNLNSKNLFLVEVRSLKLRLVCLVSGENLLLDLLPFCSILIDQFLHVCTQRYRGSKL